MPRMMTSPCIAANAGRVSRFSVATHGGSVLGTSSWGGVGVGSGVHVGKSATMGAAGEESGPRGVGDGSRVGGGAGAEVTVMARFTVAHFPAFQAALREISGGTIEADVIETNKATIMPLHSTAPRAESQP